MAVFHTLSRQNAWFKKAIQWFILMNLSVLISMLILLDRQRSPYQPDSKKMLLKKSFSLTIQFVGYYSSILWKHKNCLGTQSCVQSLFQKGIFSTTAQKLCKRRQMERHINGMDRAELIGPFDDSGCPKTGYK